MFGNVPLVVAQTQPVEDVEAFLDAGTVASVVAAFVGAYLVAKALAFMLSTAAERSPSRRITIMMFVPVVKLLVYATALYLVVVPILRLSSTQVLAVSGLLGAAIGFGLKDLAAGIVGGLLLVTEKPYQVGDKVTLDGNYGEVVDIGLRATRLRTPDDTAIVVPNDTLFKSSVANANDGSPQMLVTVELAVAPEANVDAALDIVEESLITSPYVYVGENHPVSTHIDDEVSYRTVRGRAYVSDHRHEQAFRSDVTRRALEAFEERGIETPEYPPIHDLVGTAAGSA
jgi:small-conductance mechanosensitive channel